MLRFAMCNEAFGNATLASVCRSMRDAGYTGIEIAPFTLGVTPGDVSAEKRRELRATIADSGLGFVGLHWLMVSPPGLHLTTPDASLRKRSWEHLRALIDLCGDLAHSYSVMVLGSPNQRGTTDNTTREQATARLTEGLRDLAPHAQQRDVSILIEALPANQCDVVQTLEEAAVIVEAVAHPAVQTMFDTHNAVHEAKPHSELIRKFFPVIRHVHVNELDGRYPGTGNYDFHSILTTLEQLGYPGWVSLEVFDFTPDPVTIARNSLSYLHTLL